MKQVELDMAQVRAFVAAAEELHFGRAAERLFVSQQALSKRVGKLEESLGARLFDRTTQKVELTSIGEQFLPHAIEALAAADAAVASIKSVRRTVRIDVLDERLAPMRLVRHALRRLDDLPIEVSMRHGLPNALPALRNGEADAAFGRVHSLPAANLAEVDHRLVLLEPLALLVSTQHPLAAADTIRLPDLRGVPLWVPIGGAVGEWADFLRQFASAWDLDLDFSGPSLSLDYLVDEIGVRPEVATLVGSRMEMPSADRTKVVYIVDPTPAYPWSLVWPRGRAHSLLPELLAAFREGLTGLDDVWLTEQDRIGLGT
ncbi:LysR family transcriptional regulator [Lentzea sp. NBRC 105346]|uniref:LysR family transcriptional regulator n=1 Tax=Lentzea sp. NBRC 105346 TaxID=3032205 RepID=UPI0024A34294|nr:LysR family transcriptional regulator [Lentzea sp. NBRC 105346]GLZ35179.1 LysR family transcriptional regulator [Lentzea sp. NBRC 105346]